MDNTFNRAPLKQVPFAALPLGAITPRGWLLNQMKIQAAGLTGCLEEVWEDAGSRSGWLGGSGECWERAPYYLDGLIPLAWQLRDARLMEKSQKWIEWALASQQDDGFFGPLRNRDWWPRMVMLKALMQYYEATGDSRIPVLMDRYFRYQYLHIEEQPLSMWAAARGGENAALIYRLYNLTGEEYLLRLAEIIRRQTTDWTKLYLNYIYPKPIDNYLNGRLFRAFLGIYETAEHIAKLLNLNNKGKTRPAEKIKKENGSRLMQIYHGTHGVNNAMAVRMPMTFYQQTGDYSDYNASLHSLAALFEHHGTAAGAFTGDEHLNGREPARGIELCTIVELMYSLQELARMTGEGIYGDMLEKAAFNALPASFTEDMLGHQYYQQVNQVLVSKASRKWYNGRKDANLFGIAPNFGCCAANMHQGWPKFCSHLFMATNDGGLAAVAYAPCSIQTTIGDGIPVTIEETTDYPFKDTIHFNITLDGRGEACFPVRLRIPQWASRAELAVNGERCSPIFEKGFAVIRRTWHSGDRIVLHLPMEARTIERSSDSAAVEYGPLLFALKIEEKWQKLKTRRPLPDLAVYPASNWKYGLKTDSYSLVMHEVDAVPFSHEHPAIEIKADGFRLPSWKMQHNSAGPVPCDLTGTNGLLETVILVPYGCTALRIAEFPKFSQQNNDKI